MTRDGDTLHRLGPDFFGMRGFEDLASALLEKAQRLQIVRMILKCHPKRGKSPCVFEGRIETDAVRLHRETSRMREQAHRVWEIVGERRFKSLSPSGRVAR